jgi:hypothetical protein
MMNAKRVYRTPKAQSVALKPEEKLLICSKYFKQQGLPRVCGDYPGCS